MITLDRSAVSTSVWLRRWPLLLLVYLALVFANDPGGTLSTDSGGKVATLDAMTERGDWSLDVGYWAEPEDTDGALHPLFKTKHTEHGWIQVTTLPLVLATRELYDLGGLRLALAVPMVGGLTAAFAARALARRFGGDDDTAWLAYWVVGAASPLLLYATDLWEHSWGLALMGWATVHLADAHQQPSERAAVRSTAAAGLLLGAAATMRTETFVFGAVAVAVLGMRRLRAGRIGHGLAEAAAFLLAFLPPVLTHQLLEGALVGGSIRSQRTTGALVRLGDRTGQRVEEALVTTFSLGGSSPAEIALGVLFVAVVASVVVFGLRGDNERVRLLTIVLVPLMLLRLLDGPGFVPGVLAAAPLAVGGLLVGWRNERIRPLLVGVTLALPAVWGTQFLGGAGPQWGGRYVLLFGLVATVAGLVGTSGDLRRRLVILAVGVSCFGAVWSVVRTHGVADAFDSIAGRAQPGDVVVFRERFLAREGGAAATGQRWLTAESDDALADAVALARAEGVDRVLTVDLWEPGLEGERIAFLPGLDLVIAEVPTATG